MNEIVGLIGHQRCGTHFLGSCIGSHPQVRYLDEVTTHCSPKFLRGLETVEALEAWMEKAFGKYEEPLLLLDCKYNMMEICPVLATFLEGRRVLRLVREDDEAWYFSLLHALYRKRLKLAEYAPGVFKDTATPDHEIPDFTLNRNNMRREVGNMRRLEDKYRYLAPVQFTYEGLTDNEDTKRLPEWAEQSICAYLELPHAPLTTTMTKMSPKDVKEKLCVF